MPAAPKLNKSLTDEGQLQLLYGDDSPFRHWESHLFNEVYLRKDLPDLHEDRWRNTENPQFQTFLNVLRDLAGEYKNRDKELSSWSETETINNWVKHILVALGWADNCTGVQSPFLEETSFRFDSKTYRTDILIVDHPKEKQYISQAKGDERLVEARQTVIMPIEVKYWQRLEEFRQGQKEERKRNQKEVDDITATSTPNEQIVQYMEILKKDWGILTDGARWRLFHRDLSSEDPNRYYEFNLFSLFLTVISAESEQERSQVNEAAKYFFHFFSKESFYPSDEGKESFVGEVLRYSKKYVNKVEEDLKHRFVKAMNIACNGFSRAGTKQKQTKSLPFIRNLTESALFNVLFIKSLESRGVLPMSSTDYRKISLSNLIDKIERFDPQKEDVLNSKDLLRAFRKGNGNSFEYSPLGTELHKRIVRLTMVIHDGSSEKNHFGFEISGFKESIFSDEEWKFFNSCELSNDEWVRVLFQIGYAESESLSRKYQQIPYSYFTPRQLGSIYESFLEFKLEKADTDLVYEDKRWKEADLASRKYAGTDLPTVKKGNLFFTPDNKDRKASGAYYTPDSIVRFTVSNCLGPIVRKKSSTEILKIRVCDPAMGSGHFLVAALSYLTRAYLFKLYEESSGDPSISITDAKRAVLESCIFGVDINSRAVKLAKMSLWLETAVINKTLEQLSDQLKVGNSLAEGAQDYDLAFDWQTFFKENGFQFFDSIFGNPPYIGERKNKHVFVPVQSGAMSKYYLGRMDYFYFFFHLAMDKVRPGGTIGFITTNYFPTALGAKTLRTDLKKRATILRLVNFSKLKIFNSAAGQHNLITILSNGHRSEEVARATVVNSAGDATEDQIAQIVNGTFDKAETFDIPQDSLWEGEELYLRLSGNTGFSKNDVQQILSKMVEHPKVQGLGYLCNTVCGLATCADKVFTLPKSRISEIIESPSEKVIFKPFFKSSDIEPYFVKESVTDYVIYAHEKIESIQGNRGVWKHLKSHESALRARKDANLRGAFKRGNWWALATPRLELNFEGPKLVTPYRTKTQRFAYTKSKWYASRDVYYITQKRPEIDLKYILALLNSSLYFLWLHNKGKMKGDMMEMYSQPLSEIPVPAIDASEQQSFVREVEEILNLERDSKAFGKGLEAKRKTIDKMVYKLFGLTKAQIQIVEDFAKQRIESIEAA